MRILLVCLICFTLYVCPAYPQEKISFASIDWPPYGGEHLPENGVGVAVIREICTRMGAKSTFSFMPWKRAMSDVATGKYDALFSAYDSKERQAKYAVTDPYMYGNLVLCTRKSKRIEWDGTMESLKPYKIGVVLGFVNTAEFDAATDLNKDVAPNDLLNLKKLLDGRLDAIVIDMYQAIYFLKNNPTLPGDLSSVLFLSPLLETKGIHVMFSKKNANWKERLARFNKALKEINEDGTKKNIMDKFGFYTLEKNN